ncbi:hypothetical protein Ddc_24877 [Ditylenchus destructor]|nr:hypothetical protein Ddc_24877 [Ditylenchus destructor]
MVESIRSKYFSPEIVEVLKRKYAKFFVKEEINEDKDCTEQVFEFTNIDVGKKLQLIHTNPSGYDMPELSLKTANPRSRADAVWKTKTEAAALRLPKDSLPEAAFRGNASK